MSFVSNLAIDFFVAMGMVIGGSMLGGMAAVLVHAPPMTTMIRLSDQLKIWAMVSTLGGTMDTLRVIEDGVLKRNLFPIGKQFTYLLVAFMGCQFGAMLIHWLAGGSEVS